MMLDVGTVLHTGLIIRSIRDVDEGQTDKIFRINATHTDNKA